MKRKRPGLVCLALAATLQPLGPAAADGQVGALAQVRLAHARDCFAVARAIEGAARRLEHPRCRELLSEFHGRDGRTLAEALSAESLTPARHLRRLLFYSGEHHRPCRKNALAFTSPGSRTVYVCTSRFRDAFATNPGHAELVVLHEMLHTLGLGENPPASVEITARVLAACGSS